MGIFFAAPIDQFPEYQRVQTTPTWSAALASFPASNLLTYDPTQPASSGVTNPSAILWDLGSTRSFDVVSLIWTNLTDSSTLLVEGSSDNVAWTTLYSGVALAHVVSGQTTQNKRNMLHRNHTLVHNSSGSWNFRYLRITPNSQTAGVYPSIGRLFVGTKFSPATGWQYGSSFEFLDYSARERTDQNALILQPKRPIVAASVKMDFLSKNEMMDFVWEFNYWRGSAREILACLDVEDIPRLQKNLLYCTISEGRRISFDSYNTHSATWVLESIA